MKLTIKQKKFADEYLISGNATEAAKILYSDCYGVVYMIYNAKNQKKYIGVTTRSVNQRFDEHCKAKSYVGKAIRKHGRSNFGVTIIDCAYDKDELMDLEKHYIKEYNSIANGYNQTIGGDGVIYHEDLVLNHTKEQRRFIEHVEQENTKEIDVNNKNEMVKTIMQNLLLMYLIVTKPYDKIKVSKLILKLNRKWLATLLKTRLVTYEELRHYANQRVSSFEVMKT